MGNIHIVSPTGSKSQHDENQLRSMWEQGILQGEIKYWNEGMSEWRPLSEYFQSYSDSEPPSINSAPTYSYTKNPQTLTSFLITMLWVSLGFSIVSVMSDLGQVSLLNGSFTEAEAETNDARQRLISLCSMGIFIVTGIAFLKWIYRANLNCRGFEAQGICRMKFTPGWSIGYYFIPFVNLVMPYKSMKEIWQVSKNPSDWKSVNPTSLLGWWWTLWILSNFIDNFYFRHSMNAFTIEDLQASTQVSIFGGLIYLPLCLVAMALVKTISGMQERVVRS